MSGGSMNYVYIQIEDECVGRMGDYELDNLMRDIAKLIHDREWYLSGDTCEETYFESVKAFKQKWFKTSRPDRLKEYIEHMFDKTRAQCFAMISKDDTSNDSLMTAELIQEYGEYVDKSTAAKILGVSRCTVYNMIRDGRLQDAWRGKRVSVKSIGDYIAERGEKL